MDVQDIYTIKTARCIVNDGSYTNKSDRYTQTHLPEQASVAASTCAAKPTKTDIRHPRQRLDAVVIVIGARWVEHHDAKGGSSISVARKQDAIGPLLQAVREGLRAAQNGILLQVKEIWSSAWAAWKTDVLVAIGIDVTKLPWISSCSRRVSIANTIKKIPRLVLTTIGSFDSLWWEDKKRSCRRVCVLDVDVCVLLGGTAIGLSAQAAIGTGGEVEVCRFRLRDGTGRNKRNGDSQAREELHDGDGDDRGPSYR